MSQQDSVAQASTSNTTPPADQASGANDAPQYVTVEQFAALQNEFKAALQSQSNLLGGLRNDLKGLRAKPVEPPKTEDAALTDRVKALEAREQRQKESMRYGALKAAAMSRGVPETRAEKFARLALSENAERVHVDDQFRVVFRESDEKTVGITDWVAAYLQTSDGEMFLPPKMSANSDGLRGGTAKPSVSGHPFSKLSYDEIMQRRATDRQLFDTYFSEHSDEFASKRQAFFDAPIKGK